MHKITGFVIKKFDYGADDEIVTVFSKHEIVTLIALGTRKLTSKNRVGLQIGNLVEVEYFRARLANKISKLKKASLIIQPPLRVADTADTLLSLYSYVSTLKIPSPRLFGTLIDTYSYFGEDHNQHIKTFVLFAFLDAIGQYPEANKCIECGRTDRINGFEFYRGGFTCVLHTEEKRALKELQAIQNLFSIFDDYFGTDLDINAKLQYEIRKFISENSFFNV